MGTTRISNREDGSEGDFGATSGKDRVDRGEVEHGDFSPSQGEGEAKTGGVFPGGDTELFGEGDHVADAVGVEKFDGRDVIGTS